MNIKHLYRSRTDRIFAGIFGGLGQYFEVDSVLLRVVWLVLFVVTGFFPGLLIYIFAIFIVPLEPEASGASAYHGGASTVSNDPHAHGPQSAPRDMHPMVEEVSDKTAISTPKVSEDKKEKRSA